MMVRRGRGGGRLLWTSLAAVGREVGLGFGLRRPLRRQGEGQIVTGLCSETAGKILEAEIARKGLILLVFLRPKMGAGGGCGRGRIMGRRGLLDVGWGKIFAQFF